MAENGDIVVAADSSLLDIFSSEDDRKGTDFMMMAVPEKYDIYKK